MRTSAGGRRDRGPPRKQKRGAVSTCVVRSRVPPSCHHRGDDAHDSRKHAAVVSARGAFRFCSSAFVSSLVEPARDSSFVCARLSMLRTLCARRCCFPVCLLSSTEKLLVRSRAPLRLSDRVGRCRVVSVMPRPPSFFIVLPTWWRLVSFILRPRLRSILCASATIGARGV